jgi:outer membrane beta-barrel protein
MRSQLKLQLSALVLTVAFTAQASAQSKKAKAPEAPAQAAAPAANPDKVDVTDIENKYWASKDTDFSVVQNRLFPKANRFSLSATVGPVIGNSTNEGNVYGLDATYYSSERWGYALTYQTEDLKNSDLTESFITSNAATPDFNRPKGFYGASVIFVPIYAKASVLNTSIMYFDFSVAGGLGMQTYEQQLQEGNKKKTAVAATVDFTQQFFFSNHFAVRADYRHRFYKEEVAKWRTNARVLNNKSAHDQILSFGVTFFF